MVNGFIIDRKSAAGTVLASNSTRKQLLLVNDETIDIYRTVKFLDFDFDRIDRRRMADKSCFTPNNGQCAFIKLFQLAESGEFVIEQIYFTDIEIIEELLK